MNSEEINAKIADLRKQIAILQARLDALAPPSGPIYAAAKITLGTHITLDPTVPPDVGCAEAVSYVLLKAGLPMPPKGIAGTSALYAWCQKHLKAVTDPQAGDVVISPTGMSSKGTPHGHTGIVARYGILSNDSDTGLFLEKYTLDTWKQYFGTKLGFPVFYFRWG